MFFVWAKGTGMTEINRFCVIGTPVEHSRSPKLFSRIFEENGYPGVYEIHEVRTEEELKAFFAEMREGRWKGCNITMPWKSLAVEYVDELTDSARMIGAVNTVLNENGRLIAASTDGVGIKWALETVKRPISGARIVLLGSGGAARSALSQFIVDRAEHITVVSRHGRNRVLTEQIADAYGRGTVSFEDYADAGAIQRETASADILVNCTPLGMKPGEELLPIPEGMELHQGLVVLDAVYYPVETRLMQKAADAGAITVGGVEMLTGQAYGSAEFFGIMNRGLLR